MRSQDGDRCLTIFISLSDSVGDAQVVRGGSVVGALETERSCLRDGTALEHVCPVGDFIHLLEMCQVAAKAASLKGSLSIRAAQVSCLTSQKVDLGRRCRGLQFGFQLGWSMDATGILKFNHGVGADIVSPGVSSLCVANCSVDDIVGVIPACKNEGSLCVCPRGNAAFDCDFDGQYKCIVVPASLKASMMTAVAALAVAFLVCQLVGCNSVSEPRSWKTKQKRSTRSLTTTKLHNRLLLLRC